MFDWVDSFLATMDETVNGLYDGVNQIINGTNELIDSLNTYIQFSTYYIYYSGILITIMFIMLVAMFSRFKNIDNQLTEIKFLLKGEELPLSDEDDKRFRELLILRKSNNKFYADNAEKELELMEQKGEKTNGSNDIGSNEGDNSRG